MQDEAKVVQEKRALAERVRESCIQAALDAYEQGGIAGLCEEGRWELAVDTMRALDVQQIVTRNITPLNASKKE